MNHSSTWSKTPLVREIGASVLEKAEFDELELFCLEEEPIKKIEGKTKKIKRVSLRPRLNTTWHVSNNDLEEIIEDYQNDY